MPRSFIQVAIHARLVDHTTVLPSWPQEEEAFSGAGKLSPFTQQMRVVVDGGTGEDAHSQQPWSMIVYSKAPPG